MPVQLIVRLQVSKRLSSRFVTVEQFSLITSLTQLFIFRAQKLIHLSIALQLLEIPATQNPKDSLEFVMKERNQNDLSS